MPNWCENRLRVTGEPDKLKDFVQRTQKEGKFSLDALVPMPPELNITSGSSVDSGRDVLFAEAGDWKGIDQKLSYPAWVSGAGIKETDSMKKKRKKMKEYMWKNLSQKDIDESRQSIENEKKYGCKDWYTWSNNNWGTKWDVEATIDELSDDEVEITFDSAWSPPIPWIEKVEELFPDLNFELHYDEPGMGFKGVYRNGSDHCLE